MGDPKSKSSDVYAFGMMIIEVQWPGNTSLRNPRLILGLQTLTWSQPFPSYRTVGALILALMAGKRPDRAEVDRDRAPQYWESLWKLAETCWPQDATARPTIHHVHGLLIKAIA